MPGFINGTTNVTIEDINHIVNITSPIDLYIRVNHLIYNDILFFVLLWVLFFILYLSAQRLRDQPLNNAMYSMAACSVLAFILRAITAEISGITYSLLTDHQMWIFPILTAVFALIIWSIKDR